MLAAAVSDGMVHVRAVVGPANSGYGVSVSPGHALLPTYATVPCPAGADERYSNASLDVNAHWVSICQLGRGRLRCGIVGIYGTVYDRWR
jgi:hypothetical protein